MTISRSNAVLALVVVLAIAAAVVVVHSGHARAASPAAGDTSLADSALVASSTGSALSASDPAQQVPDLDQFTSRDPFIQATGAPAASPTPAASAASSSSPSPSSSRTPSAFAATVCLKASLGARHIDETFSKCKGGDVLPPDQPLLRIAAVFGDRVKFEPIGGYRLVGTGGRTTFEVWTGRPASQSIRKGDHTTPCSLSVSHIEGGGTYASSEVGASLGFAPGHSIDVLTIGANNGVPSASFEIDGALYTGEEIGQGFATDWGQIEVMGIDEAARTVTIEHADLQETLHVGRPVSQ